MSAKLIDGKAIAQQVREQVAADVAERSAAGRPRPVLATVLVGDRPDSAAYVASKGKACLELGMGSISEHLPGDATQEQVEALVRRLNADPQVHGILVQLPMPAHIRRRTRPVADQSSRRTWMVFHRSTSAAWPRKVASRSSCPARRTAASTCSNRPG